MAAAQTPIVVSVINMKGGVGKTTVAAMLARELASRWALNKFIDKNLPIYDVLAVDLDPQANLSQALMGERGYRQFLNDRRPSIVEIFNGYRPPSSPLDIDTVVHRFGENLSLIPSRFDFSDRLISSIGTDERVLAKLIADRFQDQYLIIIDCAPTESVFTQVAYQASDYILVPVKPEFLATIGFPLLGESLTAFRQKNPAHPLEVMGVVVNNTSEYLSQNEFAVERRRALAEIHEDSINNGWYVFQNQLKYSRGFPKIMRGDYSHLGDALDIFSAFEKEFLNRLHRNDA